MQPPPGPAPHSPRSPPATASPGPVPPRGWGWDPRAPCSGCPHPNAEAGGQQHHRTLQHHRSLLLGLPANLILGFLPYPCSWDRKNPPLESQSILVYSSELRRGAEKSCRARRQIETPQAEAQSSFPSPGLSICVALIILLQLPSPHSPQSPATFLARPRSPSPAASSPGEKLGVICKCHAYFQKPARGS